MAYRRSAGVYSLYWASMTLAWRLVVAANGCELDLCNANLSRVVIREGRDRRKGEQEGAAWEVGGYGERPNYRERSVGVATRVPECNFWRRDPASPRQAASSTLRRWTFLRSVASVICKWENFIPAILTCMDYKLCV